MKSIEETIYSPKIKVFLNAWLKFSPPALQQQNQYMRIQNKTIALENSWNYKIVSINNIDL